MTRDAMKELIELFYDSLINDNDKWTIYTKRNRYGAWQEYKSPRYDNITFEYSRGTGMCYIYLHNLEKHYIFSPRIFNFKKHIRKIDKRHKLSVYDDVLKEIDAYKWSKENV